VSSKAALILARPLRPEFDGALYHVTSRGNAREDVFAGDGDRKVFLEILGKFVNRFNWLCHAYCRTFSRAIIEEASITLTLLGRSNSLGSVDHG
jgi:hypothetical protein